MAWQRFVRMVGGDMFMVRGAYHFWPKRVAFRDDYCLTCRAPRRAVAMRTFDVGHVYWIPVLPVGFWKHWQCSTCGNDPHKNPKMRRWFKWAGFMCLVAVSVIFWSTPFTAQDAGIAWGVRVAAPLLAILIFVNLLRSPKDPSLRQMLAEIPPAHDTLCPFCAAPLIAGPRWSCPGCGVVRY